MKFWDMMASYGASCFAHYFIILFGMLSGPDVLDGLIFLSSFSTPCFYCYRWYCRFQVCVGFWYVVNASSCKY